MTVSVLLAVATYSDAHAALEWSYPPSDGPNDVTDASASNLWTDELRARLPSLVRPPPAMASSTYFFWVPPTWHGVACSRVIAGRIQVVVLLTTRLTDSLIASLEATAFSFFEQTCTDDYTCVIELYDALQALAPSLAEATAWPLRELVTTLSSSLLPLLRLVLIEGRIVFFATSPARVSKAILALLSLFPGGYANAPPSEAPTAYRWTKFGLPLVLANDDDDPFYLQPYLGSAHLASVLSSHVGGCLVGSCDPLALLLCSTTAMADTPPIDAIVDLDAGRVHWHTERGAIAADVGPDTTALGATLATTVASSSSSEALPPIEYVGSDAWVVAQVQTQFFEALLKAVANPKPRRSSFTDFVWRSSLTPLDVEHHADWLDAWYQTYNYTKWRETQSLETAPLPPAPVAGHGRYTYHSGDTYVGEFLDGKRHGRGTYTVAATGYTYVGDWVHDQRHGTGVLTTHQGTYTGSWAHDARCGDGLFQDGDRFVYKGRWKSNAFHGLGHLVDANRGFVYDGEFLNGRPHGVGKASYSSDAAFAAYSGEWAIGRFDGVGTLRYRDGSVYAGSFVGGERHGQGIHADVTAGDGYDGDWQHDLRQGFGKATSGASKESREGLWRANMMVQGHGHDWILMYPSGDKYSGELQQGRPWGNGTCRYANGSVYTGDWVDGLRQGRGIFVNHDGATFHGQWRNGQPTTGDAPVYVEISLTEDDETQDDAPTSAITTIEYPNGDTYLGGLRKGKRHGRGKYISKASQHTYDGMWDMDRRHGHGVLTSGAHDFVYDGAWVHDTRNGLGKCILRGVETYTGAWRTNAFHGSGTYTTADGAVYSGEFEHGLKHGVGTLTSADGAKYQGEFALGQKHGVGTLTYANGDVYTGSFAHNVRDGDGTLVTSADTFVGTWRADVKHGPGVLSRADGTTKDGVWQWDAPVDGPWTITFPTRSVYDGACVNMRPHGHGVCKYANGDVYSGAWVHGVRSGWGVCVFGNGDVFQGEWTQNHVSLHGKGTLTLANGTVHAYNGTTSPR
ncbi:hypothetical protein SDRG_05037 [Saprolegnia diclina VS20]|uniref:AVL9/DENND6 domain-containing protein n=1 Tax=Saprolegnia diclina (strain VS20) TaxID=1156394 RepID=T0QHL0_SAPDV|nr:hypothetical protein SDRG_05037 [Saprolegnia diclina VS20]EQC37434.1 hypothetical protein SDRG_05037 [Saprolegnia diclina VS20]|eukprot:XP_008608954.1 hypothetical protein SDRG_05037 [Saprolegnia diclina VS20]